MQGISVLHIKCLGTVIYLGTLHNISECKVSGDSDNNISLPLSLSALDENPRRLANYTFMCCFRSNMNILSPSCNYYSPRQLLIRTAQLTKINN